MSELDFLESEFEDSGAGMVVSSLDSLTSEVPGASSSTSSSSSSGNKPTINPADEGTLVGKQLRVKTKIEKYQGEDKTRVDQLLAPSNNSDAFLA